MQGKRARVVALGGAVREGSSTEKALRHAADLIDAEVTVFAGNALLLPMYSPYASARTALAASWVEAVREADAVLIASPGYHGGVSGVVKNALDYLEDLREDGQPYLSGRAMGCIVTAAGAQGAVTTLSALRDIGHALRAWLTPMGVCIAGMDPAFDADGACLRPEVARQLQIMAEEINTFVQMRRLLEPQHSKQFMVAG